MTARTQASDAIVLAPEAGVTSIPNPFRFLGLARILAGAWFISTGAATLRQYHDLLPQAERLLSADRGTTGIPLWALLTLLTAAILVVIGFALAARGVAWLRRVRLPEDGPAPIARDEVLAALRNRQLPAFGEGPKPAYRLVRRWLADESADMTWWRREVLSDGVRAFARSCLFAVILAAVCVAVPRIRYDDPFGPFPTGFVFMLPFVTAVWAVFGLMLIGSMGPRVESEQLPLPTRSAPGAERIIETPPNRLDRESPALALMLGTTGIAVQCLLLRWWQLSPVDYPLRATAIVRHAGTIAGGLVFFVVGARMVAAATRMLRICRHESMLVLIDADGPGTVARAAAVRTESLGLTGPRHIVASVGGAFVRESAAALIGVPEHPAGAGSSSRWKKESGQPATDGRPAGS